MRVAIEDVARDPSGWVFAFDHPHAAPPHELTHLLGGKGAGLAEMTSGLGLPVPPGFTISLPLCQLYRDSGWPDGLMEAVAAHLERLSGVMGRRFGDPADPLLVAVRSGAPVSMPGMLDTVLNLGLNDDTVLGLEAASGQPWFAWDSYRRFLHMYATTVMGIDPAALHADPAAETAAAVREQVVGLKRQIIEIAGRPVPSDPLTQLREAIEAVFCSWDSQRASVYREREGIDETMGTAVNVQAMVFGNRGPGSGTGVVFTRNPSTGERALYGDYLPRAQGEEVVSGAAKTWPIDRLRDHLPAAYAELTKALRHLEIHYRDVCDVEFTLEEGKLWLLQTRIGKRGAVAAVRIAVELTEDPDIALTTQEALDRVPAHTRERARQEIVTRALGATSGAEHLAAGLGASPGRATGRLVLSSSAALEAADDVILVRKETSPEDVVGMSAAAGILTTRGGLVSHAAVVARGWGIPAVVGAHEIEVLDDAIRVANGSMVRVGEIVTIDGSTGDVWRGEFTASDEVAHDAVERELPHLLALERWAEQSTAVDA